MSGQEIAQRTPQQEVIAQIRSDEGGCMGAPRGTVEERFWRFVDKTNSCWIWTGSISPAGYGRFTISTSQRGRDAYRVAYELFVGPIPAGRELDHLCKNPACVNPDHLEAVTHQENMLRSDSSSGLNARKTHCPRGHVYNQRRSNGWRRCGICQNAQDQARNDRRRAARAVA